MDILVPEGEISVLDFIKFEKNEIRRFHLEWGGVNKFQYLKNDFLQKKDMKMSNKVS